ncbi:hypothetical protein MTR67_000975 [Solanum verrucosum]|uniref:Reverse transcriptase domain-containing protein n=1 Tax=Solanum verrucosum TaxID=315347 RepID=A0AAF0PQZ1_SOLVR|nr:hypothetical protein MTR67_000975 [Solanum verrucosum]
MFQIDSNKSPGPDGFGSGFYRAAWSIVGEDVTSAVLYHPMCKKVKLTHLIFVDDLMIFCKGNLASVNRVMEALSHFSAAIDLEANMEKSSVFLAGIDDDTRNQIIKRIGFVVGEFPIKYLGLPLSSKKLRKTDCLSLIDKITQRIKVTYSKKLSYAGRLQTMETTIHLFEECSWTKSVWQELMKWAVVTKK